MNADYLTGLLPDQHVNKSKPQTKEQSQSMHTSSNLSKILALTFPPNNVFWFCISNTCALFKMYNDDSKHVIYAYFEFEKKDNGLSLQLQELNTYCCKYIGCELFEIESNIGIANDSDNSNNNDPSRDTNRNCNSNVIDENNRVTLADCIADYCYQE